MQKQIAQIWTAEDNSVHIAKLESGKFIVESGSDNQIGVFKDEVESIIIDNASIDDESAEILVKKLESGEYEISDFDELASNDPQIFAEDSDDYGWTF